LNQFRHNSIQIKHISATQATDYLSNGTLMTSLKTHNSLPIL